MFLTQICVFYPPQFPSSTFVVRLDGISQVPVNLTGS